jgi:methylamine dehydrogenase accessory protein MauD
MTDALVVSNLVLWVLVVLLAGVVLALVRQVGVLHERIAPAGALMASEGPRPGESAPVLRVVDWGGRSLELGAPDPEGRSTLLFFLSPTCPVCKTLLPVLESARSAERRWLRVVIASDGAREEHEAFVGEHGLDRFSYVLSTPLGMAYRVGRLPYAVLVDGEGIVRASGLVNTREHLESLFEAQERGTASVQAYLAREEDAQRVA